MQRRWLVTLQKLPASGRQWDTDVPRTLLQDQTCGTVDVLSGLCGDLHWQLTLEKSGGVFRMSGQWSGAMKRSCGRCNGQFDWQMTGETERVYQFGTDPGDDESEIVCEYLAAPGEINLVDVLREDVWLAWKAGVICSDSCKGLCQGCGVNLNRSTCQCKQDDSDHPFAALRGLKLED
ncbi:hypothetical protein MMIC_P0112 [Mariprofundus micogutta]|uniref:DUF177 domain-containing protein n=1 Tax=Mariprofundus micogutta TaxID=1921010 RepID=A0A1L8CJU2_9PROT|nr:DUF177 domain-containing protein [Mariprofundus micogutta]GAV19183.1 hypothetical protein MMIC_P0112 [Mariprofundus micogutta]